jgi:hypothetical protein
MIPLIVFLSVTSQDKIFIPLPPRALTMGLHGCQAITHTKTIVLAWKAAFTIKQGFEKHE